ncbi:MAG: GntP family permease [Bacillota bacterium]|uniref:GntP family permease n=1 Tax=Thermanaerosceptrum fracticalcis TaxID=1712410 RepID=A0A7G6DZT5_THEFR|nr:GntP family permease [Thermanaerosceptrum fracticalcis]QNB45339.1 GntP family permease [Thermanaerosceptrum fracticalcis]
MVLGIILSLILLTIIAYRGFSVILFAPVCALVAAATAGLPLLPTYTEVFMVKAVGYVKNFFPIFLLGAVFGKVMEETGAAKAIAHWITLKLGPAKAVTAVVLACAVLTYGGVSLFVVAFAVYPFAAALFKEGNIPKRLIPACIALGSFTFTMTAFPGTPQIQNLIPGKYFGTDAYAAPTVGIIAGLMMAIGGIAWLEWRKRKLMAAGEGYGTGHINEPEEKNHENLMNPIVAMLPLFTVLVLNYVLTTVIKGWDPAFLKPYGVTLASVTATWALIIALVVGIVLALIIGWNNVKGEARLHKALNTGAIGSLLAIMNTASEVGYGNVVSSLPGFKQVADFMMSIDPGTPLVSEAITVNVLAGITGSASGGMSIALEAMGKQYLDWANAVGLNPQLLHKIASLSSGGFDSLPHNGAVITLLAICGMNHRASYPDIGMVSVVIPFVSTFFVIILATLFGIV